MYVQAMISFNNAFYNAYVYNQWRREQIVTSPSVALSVITEPIVPQPCFTKFFVC